MKALKRLFLTTHHCRLGALQLRLQLLTGLFVLALISSLLRLGLWQLDRAREQLAEQESYSAMSQEVAHNLDALSPANLELDRQRLQNIRVRARGEYWNEKNIFLIYQTHEEQLGFEVLTPFRLQDGRKLALVSRGWSGLGSEQALAEQLQALEGEREIEAQLFVPSAAQAGRSNPDFQTRWPLLLRYLHIPQIASLFPEYQVFPYVLRLSEQQAGVLVRHWPTVVVNTERHYSYALQWFAMAIATALVSLLLCSNALQLWEDYRSSPRT